jgi:hypothetical protein
MDAELKVIDIALRKIAEEFDRFVSACMDERGDPKAPAYKDLMRARGYLPPYCENALTKPPAQDPREMPCPGCGAVGCYDGKVCAWCKHGTEKPLTRWDSQTRSDSWKPKG